MRMRRRIDGIFVVVIVAFVTLVGCGKRENGTNFEKSESGKAETNVSEEELTKQSTDTLAN